MDFWRSCVCTCKVPIDWVDVPVQKQRGPNGVEIRTSTSHDRSKQKPKIMEECILPFSSWIPRIYIFFKYNVFNNQLCCLDDFSPYRKMPIVMPHKLVCEPEWPSADQDDVRQYWEHLEKHASPIAELSPTKCHVPLWIWGDECQFRENGCGYVLDKRKFSIECCYPLALCRSEAFPINEIYTCLCFVFLFSFMFISLYCLGNNMLMLYGCNSA